MSTDKPSRAPSDREAFLRSDFYPEPPEQPLNWEFQQHSHIAAEPDGIEELYIEDKKDPQEQFILSDMYFSLQKIE